MWLARALPVVLFMLSCSPARTTPATPRPTQRVTAAPPTTSAPISFDVDRALAHVRYLAERIGIREAGTTGDVAAASYITSEISKLGWRAELQTFPLPKGGTSSNVIGMPRGFDERAPYLIVGGHRDSLRGPGANDNATGVGVALEIARIVARDPAPLPVIFVAFGAEERESDPARSHHVGSRAYVAAMSQVERRNLVAFVNLDMVGRGVGIHCPRLPTGPQEGADRCVRIARDLGYAATDEIQPNYSDHGTFLLNGLNAAWIWAGDDLCCFHSPRDTMARVQRDEVERAGRVALGLIRSYHG